MMLCVWDQMMFIKSTKVKSIKRTTKMRIEPDDDMTTNEKREIMIKCADTIDMWC